MHLLIRFAFRIAALALKFALTIIVARTIGFAAVADYGLALAISVVSSKLLGLGFSTEINRRLSGVNPVGAMDDARHMLFLYCVVYAVITVVVMIVYKSAVFDAFSRVTPLTLWGVMLVAFSEHAALETTSYVFSLHQQSMGALLLFIRTGGWAAVAMLGLLGGAIHSTDAVFALWYGTNVVAVLVAYRCALYRGRDAESGSRIPSEGRTDGFRSVWMDGLPFYLAAIVLSVLQYGERFIASSMLSPDMLGRYVFAWSISNSVQTIAYATIVVTAGPRLVRSLSTGGDDYRATLRRSLLCASAITLLSAAAILIVHKPIFRIAHEPAGSREFGMLVILLVSFLLRSIADVCWASAIALRLGKQVAVAILCVAAISIPVGWMLINGLGEIGAALAHLAASAGIVAILTFIVMRPRAVDLALRVNGDAIHAA